ncbi:MAG: YHYH protein [Flavobacteriales bacterium]|jgi:hypothetical protein|nr:YHYH protein [Flavobacteriales bacterium]
MKTRTLLIGSVFLSISTLAQTNSAVSSWMINTTNITARHYVNGNSIPIEDNEPANVQSVQFSTNYCYVSASGLPAYIIGPYLDGNPSQASNNEHIFKIPLSPVENTGTLTSTPLGAIGAFVNGVPMYDYKDGVSYSYSSGADAGGPLGGNGDGVWNRDAIKAENDGFDCAKGHPSPIFSGGPGGGGPGGGQTLVGGTYHHHQNPTAFNLDRVEVSDVCDLYLADGLYTIDSTQHAPLIGYAFDGFPVYGAYGYANTNGTGGIKRIESSYQLRNITERTHYADGTDVTDGPTVSATFPLGYYREDYEFIANSGDLDIHNGRFCVTPEYPNGIYCYFATVDQNWNSAYPYLVGPEYYGVVDGGSVNNINENVQTYTAIENEENDLNLTIFPNPSADIIAIQYQGMVKNDIELTLYNIAGKVVLSKTIYPGSTIAYIDTQTLYAGNYILLVKNGKIEQKKQIIVTK